MQTGSLYLVTTLYMHIKYAYLSKGIGKKTDKNRMKMEQ